MELHEDRNQRSRAGGLSRPARRTALKRELQYPHDEERHDHHEAARAETRLAYLPELRVLLWVLAKEGVEGEVVEDGWYHEVLLTPLRTCFPGTAQRGLVLCRRICASAVFFFLRNASCTCVDGQVKVRDDGLTKEVHNVATPLTRH